VACSISFENDGLAQRREGYLGNLEIGQGEGNADYRVF